MDRTFLPMKTDLFQLLENGRTPLFLAPQA
ncbi:uncharacterized protein METZ01_LOCUS353488, partial [marine metagenome]